MESCLAVLSQSVIFFFAAITNSSAGTGYTRLQLTFCHMSHVSAQYATILWHACCQVMRIAIVITMWMCINSLYTKTSKHTSTHTCSLYGWAANYVSKIHVRLHKCLKCKGNTCSSENSKCKEAVRSRDVISCSVVMLCFTPRVINKSLNFDFDLSPALYQCVCLSPQSFRYHTAQWFLVLFNNYGSV